MQHIAGASAAVVLKLIPRHRMEDTKVLNSGINEVFVLVLELKISNEYTANGIIAI